MSPPGPGKTLGEIIYKSRLALNMTQDEFGQRYGVSGPAVFKFEKGYVRPSLDLWLRMVGDLDMTEKRAVLLWIKSKLPIKYQHYLELTPTTNRKHQKQGLIDYSTFESAEEMRVAAAKDRKLPKGLHDVLSDDEVWSLYKPTGHEINLLSKMFPPLGKGSKSAYREALRLVREFTHSF